MIAFSYRRETDYSVVESSDIESLSFDGDERSLGIGRGTSAE
jgi:hypothetical protein